MDPSHTEGDTCGKSWDRSHPAPGLSWISRRHHNLGSHTATEVTPTAGEGCTKGQASQPGTGHPFPVSRAVPCSTDPQSLPQSILETTPVPHEQGRWRQGRQCRRLGTDLCSGRISVIPVPAAWAPLELPPGPVQELRANPGTHSIEATKQFSHKNILISRGQRAFFLPGAGSLGRGAVRHGHGHGQGTGARWQPRAHRGSQHTPKYLHTACPGRGHSRSPQPALLQAN